MSNPICLGDLVFKMKRAESFLNDLNGTGPITCFSSGNALTLERGGVRVSILLVTPELEPAHKPGEFVVLEKESN